MVVGSAPVSVANPTTKFDAGASYPAHDRPAGDEVFSGDGGVLLLQLDVHLSPRFVQENL
jgi:hypothetical protein